MEHNPYAAPRADVLPATVSPKEQQLASRLQRLGNLLLDSFGYYCVMFAITVVAFLVDPPLADRLVEHSWIFTLTVMLLYYIPSEALFGRTPAKLMTGTRTVSDAGLPPTFRQVLGRTLVRFVPFEPFSCLGDPPVGWHDQWSRTRVVRTRPSASGSGHTLQASTAPARTGPLGP